MFKKIKKFLALTLTVLMLINALPVSALGEIASEWLSIAYSYDDDSEGGSISGREITLPVYFYDTVRGELAEKKTSITVDRDGVYTSSNMNIQTVLGELGGEYASAVLADDDSSISSGTEVSYLRVAGSNGNYYLTDSRSDRNPTSLEYQGMNLYVRFNPAQPAVSLPAALELSTGESKTIAADVANVHAGEATITWASSSTGVTITVDSADPAKATIRGASPVQGASVTVTVSVPGFSAATATMTVDVVQGVNSVSIYQDGVNVNGKTFNMETGGKQLSLTASVSPSNATDKTLTWTSSNPAVASVNNGKVTTGNVAGSATISAVASNGVKASVVVHTHAFSLEVEPAVVNIVEEEVFYIYPLISSITNNWTLTATPADSTVVLATWNQAAGEVTLTAAELPEGVQSASTTVEFTLTHTIDGKTESKTQTITVNVSPSEEKEYYTVSLFDMSGVLFESTSVAEGSSYTLPTAEDMAVDGYIFNGFKDLENADTPLYSGTIENVQENIILMADYTIKQHKVTFVVHDGEGANPGEKVVWVDHGDVVERPADPAPTTYNGYVATKFIDWHDHHNHTLRNSYDFWTPVTGDITLCAHFEEATFDVMLVTFAGTYKTYTFSARDSSAVVSLPTKTQLDNISVTLPESADIEAENLGGYYTDKDEDATERKWSYFRFWQIAGTSSRLNVSSLDFDDLMGYAYDASTGEWSDVIINAVYEPNTNGGSTRPYQSLNVTVPVRVITEDGYVLGMGEVYTKVTPSFGVGKGSSSVNGYNTTKVTDTTAKFGTVDLNGLDVTVTDSEGKTATYTIVSGEDGNLVSDVELVWLCQMAEHVYGAMGSLANTHFCAGGCWNVLGIATVVVRLHSDDVRLRVNYYNIPEGGTKADAEQMKSLFFGDDDGKLENGDVLTYLDYVDGIGQTYSYHSHDWIKGKEGEIAQNGNSYVLNIYYTHEPHTVTVYYVYEDGTTAAPSKSSTLHKNTYYFITSPEIPGYEADVEIVRGKMPGHDLEFTVTYYAMGHLEITKQVVDAAFDPDKSSFSFQISSLTRGETSTAMIKDFIQNADGSWTGSVVKDVPLGKYSVTELNVPDKYTVSYSTTDPLQVSPANTANNPAKITVTNTAKLPVVSIDKVVTSEPANGAAYALGEVITYKLIVSNSGNVAAANVQVVDELTDLSEVVATLAAGDSEEFTTSYTVTEADILKGSVVNVATAGDDSSEEVEVETEDPAPELTVTKTADKLSEVKAGDVVTYTIVVENTGNVTITGITVTDDLTGDKWTIASLAPGAEESFTAAYTVTAEDILAGKIENIAAAKGSDPDGEEVKGEDSEEVIPVPAEPELQVEKTVTSTPANGEFYVKGETVAYKIAVTNSGNVPMTNIAVTDDLTGDAWTIAALAVGEAREFTTTYTITEADVQAGAVANVAAANDGGTEGEDEVDVPTGENPAPELTVTKVSNTPNGVALGEDISYSITVKNSGNVVITGITVTDDLTGEAWLIDSLAPGAYEIFTTSYTVTEDDIAAKQIVNTAAASGKDPSGSDVSDDDTAIVTPATPNKAWAVSKKETSKPASGDRYLLGETITYEITVKNTGNQTLTNLTVTDAKIGLNEVIDELAIGESETFTGAYVVTQADVAKGFVENTAYADGVPSNKVEVKTEQKNTAWTITKSVVGKTTGYKVGEVVNYKIVVTNTGNQDIPELLVKDDKVGLRETIYLPVKGTRTFTREYVVTDADFQAGKITNIAYAGNVPSREVEVTTEEKVSSWTINKRVTSTPANGSTYALGEVVTYKITVKNTGNMPVPDLQVIDALIDLDETIDLPVGGVETFEGSHIVTEKDIAYGEITNIAFAGKESSEEVVVETEPSKTDWTILKEEKSTPKANGKYALGEEITYQITVKNTGNQTINNLRVTDAKVKMDETIDHLLVGDSKVFTVRYIVTEDDIRNEKVVNTAWAGDKSSTETVKTEEHNPELYVEKIVLKEQSYYKLGEVIQYQITVKNTGNVTHTNVPVKDELIGLNTVIPVLAVGEEKVFTGSYTVKEADVLRGYVHNVATAGGFDDEYTVDTEEPVPAWTVEKTVPNAKAEYKLGDKISYQITVKNTGNVTLNSLRVVDELIGLDDTIRLGIGESEIFTGSYLVKEIDILRGYVLNVVTATSDGKTETDEHTETTEDIKPSLDVGKLVTSTPANGSTYQLGETVRYSIHVRNSGNVRINNIAVSDNLTGDAWTIASLAPGAVESFTTSYVVTEADILRGSVVNVATAKGTAPTGKQVQDSDDAIVNLDEGKAGLKLDKETIRIDGRDIHYQITVRNTGNLTISDISVTDELTGDAWTIRSLKPGGVETFQAMYTVQESDILVGSVTNIAKASGTDPEGEKVEDQDEVTDPTEKANPAVDIEKTVLGQLHIYKVGEVINYQITVKNTGNLTLTNVKVEDKLVGLSDTIDHLSPGAVETYTASWIVLEDDLIAGSVVNLATVQADTPDPDQPTASDEDKVEVDVEDANPDLHVVKTVTSTPADGVSYKLGEEITYSIRVHNGGNLRLTGITIEDELTGDSWYIEALPRGTTKEFEVSYIVTETDILAGSVVNVATGKGNSTDPDQPTVEDEDEIETEVEDPNPSLTVEKTTTSTPADGVAYDIGEIATFRIVVTNTGNLTITDIVVDDFKTFDTWQIESLAPGESREFTAECYVLDEDAFIEKLVNIATAKGKDPTGEDVEGEDTTEDPVKPDVAEIQVEKTITSTPANGVAYIAGETITYEIVVSNTGNLRLLHVTVEDELTGDEWYFEAMPRYTSKTLTASYVVTEADMIAGSVLNVVTAWGETSYPEIPPVEDQDEVLADVEDSDPAIEAVKTVTSTPADGVEYGLDETITYQIVVKNTGNITVKNIVVADELTGDNWTIESLAPGAEEIFTASYIVTEADMIAGSVVNVATVKGETEDPDEPGVEDEDEIETDVEDSDPSIEVVKTVTSTPADGVLYMLGETITYQIVVKNTGNITVKNIAVADEFTGDTWAIESLAPGAEEIFTTSWLITEADLIAGSVINVATAKGETEDPDEPGVEDEDEIETDVEDSDPSIEVVKTITSTPANGVAYIAGETITYEIVVTNTGNIRLLDVVVEDELTGDLWEIEVLVRESSKTFTASYLVTEADMIAGSVLNVVTVQAKSDDPKNPTVSDEDQVEADVEDADPAIEVDKYVVGSAKTYILGERITYRIVVKNTGNISVSNIIVEDKLTGDEWTIEILAPGEEVTFTAKHTVTEEDVRRGKVANVATATGTTEDPDEPTVEEEDKVVVEIVEVVVKQAGLGRVVMNVGDCFE